MRHLMTRLLAPMAALGLFAGAANADVIQPTGVDASSVWSGAFPEALVIDGSGLSDATVVETGDPVPSPSWPTNTNTGSSSPQSNWISATKTSNEWIMFDLGQSYELGGMHIWNYNHTGFVSRGINAVNIKFSESLTGTFGSTDQTDTGWGTATAETFSQASGLSDYVGETISLASPVTARYVLFDVQTNHGGDFVGLEEVRFTEVPEPGSLALLGLGGLLIASRRRRD